MMSRDRWGDPASASPKPHCVPLPTQHTFSPSSVPSAADLLAFLTFSPQLLHLLLLLLLLLPIHLLPPASSSSSLSAPLLLLLLLAHHSAALLLLPCPFSFFFFSPWQTNR